MNFNGRFVYEVMSIINGGFVMSRSDATSLSALLGSREEFAAWLLLRSELPAKHPRIGEALAAVSSTVVTSAATPRAESGYPIFEHEMALEVEKAMKSLIEAEEASRKKAEDLEKKLNHFPSYPKKTGVIRHSLIMNWKGL